MITGGPSTGKTSVILELENRGCFCIPELVRSLTVAEAAAKNVESIIVNPILSVKDSVEFNKKRLNGRIGQYRSVEKPEEKVVFFDRSIPDVHAYMTCFGQEYTKDFERPAHSFRYDQVLLMPPWREIYATDSERFESYSTSERIFTALEETYRNFGYEITLIPKGSVMERTDFILDMINPK